MLNKLHQKHGNNRNYLKPKSDINTSFGLNHFAGVVFYDTRSFLDKNRDTFSADLLQLIHHCPMNSEVLKRPEVCTPAFWPPALGRPALGRSPAAGSP